MLQSKSDKQDPPQWVMDSCPCWDMAGFARNSCFLTAAECPPRWAAADSSLLQKCLVSLSPPFLDMPFSVVWVQEPVNPTGSEVMAQWHRGDSLEQGAASQSWGRMDNSPVLGAGVGLVKMLRWAKSSWGRYSPWHQTSGACSAHVNQARSVKAALF